MSVLFYERAAAGHGAWQAFADWVRSAIAEMRRQSKARRDRRHLMQLPDYLLRDIGVSRVEVEAMTWRDDQPRFPIVPEIGWRRNP